VASIHRIWTARIAGGLAGVAAAAALLIASHPAQGGQAVGAEVTAHADQGGAIAVTPASPANFLHARALHPGESATGAFTVISQTGQTQLVRATASASDPKLQHLVSLAFVDAGRVKLRPGGSAPLTATVTLRRAAGTHWQAALIDYAVVLHTRDAP